MTRRSRHSDSIENTIAFNDLLLVVRGLLETSGSHRFDMESLVAVSDAPKVPNPNGFAMSCRVAGLHHGIGEAKPQCFIILFCQLSGKYPQSNIPSHSEGFRIACFFCRSLLLPSPVMSSTTGQGSRFAQGINKGTLGFPEAA